MSLLSSPNFDTNLHPVAEDEGLERVRVRTRELALDAGRVPPHVLQVDYEQAKREVMGEAPAAADGWDEAG
ncbi:hypothetical protein [Rariglobus hedericola]|uniref:Uncharacterized protein n=1 Tax=Rariglobus hedericola TaxID=2597822 RepID=A0A556QS40_9BACT|nr:hypothetical protein [Rariglobus hedericola]TSJ79443.1 hypothetical protein FPL22_09190 [Rariglobus hedericola]